MKGTCLLLILLVLAGLAEVVAGPGRPPSVRQSSRSQKRISRKADRRPSASGVPATAVRPTYPWILRRRGSDPPPERNRGQPGQSPAREALQGGRHKLLGAIRLRRPLKEPIRVDNLGGREGYDAEVSDLPQIDDLLVRQNVPTEKRARILHHARDQAACGLGSCSARTKWLSSSSATWTGTGTLTVRPSSSWSRSTRPRPATARPPTRPSSTFRGAAARQSATRRRPALRRSRVRSSRAPQAQGRTARRPWSTS